MSAKRSRGPSLAKIMRDLRAAADKRGDSGVYPLSHGATLQMLSKDTEDSAGRPVVRRRLILARHQQPLGLVETDTFLGHGEIPARAIGTCYFPTRAGWWRVTYEWDVSLQPFEILPLPLQ